MEIKWRLCTASALIIAELNNSEIKLSLEEYIHYESKKFTPRKFLIIKKKKSSMNSNLSYILWKRVISI